MIYLFIDTITNTAGTERAVTNLANNLKEHGHQVNIVSIYSAGGKPAYPLSSGVEVEHLGFNLSSNRFARKLVYFAIRKRIKYILKDNTQKHLAIGTNIFINTILSNISSKSDMLKTIGCEHISYNIANPLTRQVRGLLYSRLNAVVSLTERDKIAFESVLKGYSVKVYNIPNEVSSLAHSPEALTPNDSHSEDIEIAALEDKEPEQQKTKTLLGVGRLTHQKAFEYMILAVAPVLRKRSDWRLIIVGEGEDKDLLYDLIKKEYMEEHIAIEPFTDQIEKYYEESSIFLMTSRYEGLPMVLLEAQSYGLPILCYDCPTGPKELIDNGDNGFLIPMGDKEGFQKALLTLIDNDTLREEMGEAAKKAMQAYSPQAIYAKWENLFAEIGYYK